MAEDKTLGDSGLRTNADYSDSTITPAQRGHFMPMTRDGAWASPWTGSVDAVENAHDQQAADTHAYEAPLDNDATPLKPAPVADRADDA